MSESYCLPVDWDFMSNEARIQWHMERVEKEAQVFNSLEEDGILTCFEPHEVRERLALVRREKKMVETALLLAESRVFQDTVGKLRGVMERAKTVRAERVRIMNLQFRRSPWRLTQDEEVRLRVLREQYFKLLDDGEVIEGEIIRLCDEVGADFGPFMMVDEMREQA